ncbi:DUF418 domain-containing protein [Paenibacillus xylanexedens]|uniref:DUF418 domain-containing protein n=1 Tax=Paenibacillus xylanexedens TaxID=528191 RepID=UPI000F53C779|nr:DUF418 domain-containing protein [Paenibacillus xylanexedens]RPK31362.1 hypothetical protein EDO6_01989 [Paenibacillus xylanexedens]
MSNMSTIETTNNSKRAVSLDLARGAMLLLIALAHAPHYLYNNKPGIMFKVESVTFFDQLVNILGLLAIDNRARPMFAVLFGYGLILIYNSQIKKGKREADAVKIIRRRSWYLFVFGMALTIIIGGQDILMAYGVAGLIVSRLVTRENKTLIRYLVLITVICALIVPFLWGAMGGNLPHPALSADDTYLDIVITNLIIFPMNPLVTHVLFPILPSVLLGMWMARQQLLTKPERRLNKLRSISIIGLTISLLGALPICLVGNLWTPELHTVGFLSGVHMITGIAGGAAYAAIFGIIGAKMAKVGIITRSLMAVGKRSLTFFVWNEALLVLYLSPVAFDLGGRVSNGMAALIGVGIWISSVLLATILEINKINGPLERLLQRLVHKNN